MIVWRQEKRFANICQNILQTKKSSNFDVSILETFSANFFEFFNFLRSF